MADKALCIKCQRTREGRYTRERSYGLMSSKLKDEKALIPHWYCWTCLKPGQGKDEDEETAMAKMPKSSVVSVVDLNSKKAEGLALINPIVAQVTAITISSPEDYERADELLGQISKARKVWGGIWGMIQDKTVRPLREALEGAYEVNRAVDGPVEKAEKVLKGKMGDYKTLEAKRIRQEQEQKEQEARRIQEEIDRKQRQAEEARTPQMRGKIAAQVVKLAEQAEQVFTDVEQPVVGMSSAVRSTPTPRIARMGEFWTAVEEMELELDEKIQAELTLWLKREYKRDPDTLKAMPGIVIEDVIGIARR